MKYITQIQTIIIIILFGIILFEESTYDKQISNQIRYFKAYSNALYNNYSEEKHKLKNRIDSLESELLIKQIDIGRYEVAIDYLDSKCKKQFESNCRE
jgi:hypothetical protein